MNAFYEALNHMQEKVADQNTESLATAPRHLNFHDVPELIYNYL